MASKYLSSSETTNFARLSRLVVDVISDLLRAVLKAKVPPLGLTAILQSQRVQLLGNLEPRQRHVLFPPGGVFVGTLEDLDFTLLYRLVRHIQGINIKPHQNGWGATPDPKDRSLSANIDRLRVQRNEAYGHLPTSSLSDADLNSRWSLIRQSVEKIEKDALTGDTYVTAVDALLTMNMDPEAEKYYIEELEKQHKADLEVKAMIRDIKAGQEAMATNVSDVSTRQEAMATNISDVSTRQEAMATNISNISTRQDAMATNVSDVSTRQEAMATNISAVSTRQDAMATNVSDVSTRQEAMATNISDVTTRQEVMATNISDVTTRQEVMATNISDVTTRQEAMSTDIHNLQDDVTAIKDTVDTTSANTGHVKAIHPDLIPMIETTKARIKKEKEESKFYPTKGFRHAKDKLLKNRVVVIKGNTGDGKTAMAVQLLHWLSQEQGTRHPLQLHKVKKLDVFAPNLNLITFIDDIFGEKDICKKDVREWNKRISVVDTLFLDEQIQSNFLIITIRNEVFNSLEKRSLGRILTKVNIVDLSSHTYKIAGEKKQLLDLYKPENFSWTDTEKSQIVTYAPNIGFPQCCQLFYNSKELQKERVRFFENPFHFLNEALSKLQECSALLYLFLNNGMIKVKNLDPNNTKINEKLLEQAFSIKLIGGKYCRPAICNNDMEKVVFLKDSFNELIDFLIKKEKHWLFNEEVYTFNHDSIFAAVAILYGNVTPIGYIQNCPSKFLGYLTTSEATSNRVAISSNHYTEMCERLHREFEYQGCYYQTSIGSLDVWNDPIFVKTFVKLLDNRQVNKLAVLNKACVFGAEECVLYLLSEGVEPDPEVVYQSLMKHHWMNSHVQMCLLKRIIVNLNDEQKVALLNKACSWREEECILYLLSEVVKPDPRVVYWILMKHRLRNSHVQMCFLKKIIVYLNDEQKVALLNEACSWREEECVLYLLSEVVKPDPRVVYWTLMKHRLRNSHVQMCFLKKIIVYLNDEQKVALLNKACSWREEECVLYLLSEGVKPDPKVVYRILMKHNWMNTHVQMCLLKKICVYLNDEQKVALLNEACSWREEECFLYLLSEGVKPDPKVVYRILMKHNWMNRHVQMCLLKKICVNLNDEQKVALLNEACSWRKVFNIFYPKVLNLTSAQN